MRMNLPFSAMCIMACFIMLSARESRAQGNDGRGLLTPNITPTPGFGSRAWSSILRTPRDADWLVRVDGQLLRVYVRLVRGRAELRDNQVVPGPPVQATVQVDSADRRVLSDRVEVTQISLVHANRAVWHSTTNHPLSPLGSPALYIMRGPYHLLSHSEAFPSSLSLGSNPTFRIEIRGAKGTAVVYRSVRFAP
jgi:hypothetical protein